MNWVAVLSGSGGAGKTTVTANLGVALAKRNALAVDCDLGSAHLTHALGAERAVPTLTDVLRGRGRAADALFAHASGLKLLPAGPESKGVDHSKLAPVLRAEPMMESGIALLDCAPGMGREAMAAARAADRLLFVAPPTHAGALALVKLRYATRELQASALGVVLNRVQRAKHELRAAELSAMVGLPVLGEVPEDDAVGRSWKEQSPVVASAPHSKAGKALRELSGAVWAALGV